MKLMKLLKMTLLIGALGLQSCLVPIHKPGTNNCGMSRCTTADRNQAIFWNVLLYTNMALAGKAVESAIER